MKNHILVFLFFFAQLNLFSQNIKKQLAELDTAYYHGDYEKAKQLIGQLEPKASKIKNVNEHVSFLNTCGSVYFSTNDFASAGKYFSMAAEKGASLGEKDPHYNLALFNLAATYKEQGRYTESEPLYLRSLPVLAEAFGQSSIEYTRCFYSLALLYIEMSRFRDAEGMCAAAVNFFKEISGQSSPDYLGSLGAMAVIYQGLGNYEKAEEIFVALLNYFTSLPQYNQETVQTLQNNLGELYRNMGDYDRAESALQQAIKLCPENSLDAATALNNFALVEKALGKYTEAEAAYKRSISIYKQQNRTGHPDYCNPVNNLGELYRVMGRLQEAVDAFEEVINLRRKLLGTEHPNYANALNNLALVEFSIGDYDASEKHLLECRDIYKRTMGETDKFYANSLNNLGSLYKAKGDLTKAEEYYLLCLSIYKKTYGETSDKYGVYMGGLAGVYRAMKKYDKAVELTKTSMQIIKNKLGEKHYDHIETEYNLAETFRVMGNFKDAEKHYLKSLSGYLFLIEKYFPALSEKEKTSFYYTVSNAFETYNSFVIQLAERFPKENHDTLLFRMYDNQLIIKSLLLKEAGKMKTQIEASGDPQLKQDYEQLLIMRETIVQQYRMSAEELRESGIDVSFLEKTANELEQKINAVSAIQTGNTDSKTASWIDIRSVLGAGECAVEMIRIQYYTEGNWTDSVYYAALIIDQHSAAPQLVIMRDGNRIENKVLPEYRKLMRSRKTDANAYSALWTPVQRVTGKASRIYFSPDGSYQQVNLYTLKDPVSKKFLIEESNIVLLTNTRDLLEKKLGNPKNTASIFSYPDYDLIGTSEIKTDASLSRYGFTYLQELPGTKTEADSILKILRSRKWTVDERIQGEASEENIKKVKGPKILHIATHGFFLEDVNDKDERTMGMSSSAAKQNPLLRSGLMLAGAAAIARDSILDKTREDGILTAYEAADLDLGKTDLVVLSACETGLGVVQNGQGVYGLQRAFMVAGAKAVIMSLWMVDDNATQELMSNFYREWLKDPSASNKQKAFRKAQLKLKEKYPAPYFWGAFVMIGK